MKPQTFTLLDFSGGIDVRDGIMAHDTRSVRDSVNYITTSGKKRRTRPPRRALAGSVTGSKGARFVNGKLCVIAARGDVIVNTVTEYPVQVLRFDPPDAASGEWELVDFRVMGTTPVAWIRHRFDSVALQYRYFLHVWDDAHPTYVTDPACPYSWEGDLPLHPFGQGKLNKPSLKQLRMSVAGNRVWITSGDGNVKGSGVNRPRVWTQRTPDELLGEGVWYYQVASSGSGLMTMIVPVPFFDLIADQRYASYIVDVCLADGTWLQLDQTYDAPTLGQFSIHQIPAPWDSLSLITRVIVNYPFDGAVVRFKVLARPPATIDTGIYLNADGSIVSGVVSHEGRSHFIDTVNIAALVTPGTSYYILAPVPGTPFTIPRVVAGSPGSMPLSGRIRYWARILGVLSATGTVPAFLYAIAGTTSIIAGSSKVIGVGTLFQSQLETGRIIEVNGEKRTVKNIASDLELEVDSAFSSSGSGLVTLRDYRYRYAYEVGPAGNSWYVDREADATFRLSGTDDAVTLPTAVLDPEGNVPVSISATQNRLLIQYPSTLQLWGIDPIVTSIRQLSVIGQGAGPHLRPEPVMVDGWVVIPTSAGVRMFSPDGNNKDYINFLAIGDRLEGVVPSNLDRAVWWHALRCYLTMNSTDGTIYCLSVHQNENIMAWDTWKLPGITVVDDMITAGDDLIIRSGDSFHRLRISDRVYQDDGQPTPIVATTRWDYLDLGVPNRNKRIVRLELYQLGSSKISFHMNPAHGEEVAPGPRIIGRTMGLQKIPMAVMGPAIAVEIESSDVAGHFLEQIDLDFILLNR